MKNLKESIRSKTDDMKLLINTLCTLTIAGLTLLSAISFFMLLIIFVICLGVVVVGVLLAQVFARVRTQ